MTRARIYCETPSCKFLSCSLLSVRRRRNFCSPRRKQLLRFFFPSSSVTQLLITVLCCVVLCVGIGDISRVRQLGEVRCCCCSNSRAAATCSEKGLSRGGRKLDFLRENKSFFPSLAVLFDTDRTQEPKESYRVD